MPRPPHSPWVDLPNDIWGRVQIMKLLVVRTTSSSLLLRHPSMVQIFSLEACFQTPQSVLLP
jgi:hypothetical protein